MFCLRTNLTTDQTSRSCIYMYTLFLPHGLRFLRYGLIFKIQKLHIYTLYPRGSKLRGFSLQGQRFSRYGSIFKIAIFRHETWLLAKISEVAQILFLTQGVEIELNFALRAVVSEIRYDFQTWPLAKVPEIVHIFPKVWFAPRLPISKILANF